MDKLPCAMVGVWQTSAFTSTLGIRTSLVVAVTDFSQEDFSLTIILTQTKKGNLRTFDISLIF